MILRAGATRPTFFKMSELDAYLHETNIVVIIPG